MFHDSPSDQLFAFPSSDRRMSFATISSSSSYSSSASPSTSASTMEIPTPPSYSLFDSEMDHIFHETIDTSFLDSRPSSPHSFQLPVLEPVGNLEPRSVRHEHLLSTACPPHLTLSLPPQSASLAPSGARHNDAETKRQIDVLTTILTSPNLLPTSLPSLPIPVRPRSRSPSSSGSSSTSPSRAKNEILGSTSSSMKSQRSWLDALREAEVKAKAKKTALGGGGGVNVVTGFARL